MVTGRRKVLEQLGARGAVLDELVAYTDNPFCQTDIAAQTAFPLADEPFVTAWERYATQAKNDPALALRTPLVQTHFPIRAGLSQQPAYRDAVRAGRSLDENRLATGLVWRAPERIRVFLHATAAGRIPIIAVAERGDFEDLLRALVHHNEPVAIPASMGAMMIAGYNNWDRIHAHRRAFIARCYANGELPDWRAEFVRLQRQPALYQDRFIIVSEGPYSDVPARALGLDDAHWAERSLRLRIEHECTHYFTKRVFGAMRNNLLDEIIADYMGIVAAQGRFSAQWFLQFMGLEDFPSFRAGGRLQNYRGDPPLSDEAFRILQALVVAAARGIEQMDASRPEQALSYTAQGRLITTLSQMTLQAMAEAGRDS